MIRRSAVSVSFQPEGSGAPVVGIQKSRVGVEESFAVICRAPTVGLLGTGDCGVFLP